MSDNLIDYWIDIIQKNKEFQMEPEGYIFKYSIINMFSNEGVSNWVSCNSWKKLFSFIKYVILPSVEISRIVGRKEESIVFGVYNYEAATDILENCNIDGNKRALEAYNKFYDEAGKLEKGDVHFDKLKKYVDKLAVDVELNEGIYVHLEVFENINKVGQDLIVEYEDEGMLDYLEDIMEMSKEQMQELFENIDKNPFMKKKILGLMNERYGL